MMSVEESPNRNDLGMNSVIFLCVIVPKRVSTNGKKGKKID